MTRKFYSYALSAGLIFIAGCNSGGSNNTTPSCASGQTLYNNTCTNAYGAYGAGYGGCTPCTTINGAQGIQTAAGCGTPIQQANGQCTAIVNGQIVQGIPNTGYGTSGYPYGGSVYPYGGTTYPYATTYGYTYSYGTYPYSGGGYPYNGYVQQQPYYGGYGTTPYYYYYQKR